jgi:hypothetical protein
VGISKCAGAASTLDIRHRFERFDLFAVWPEGNPTYTAGTYFVPSGCARHHYCRCHFNASSNLLTLVFIFKVELLGFARAFGVAVASNELTLVQALFAFSYLWAFILCFHLTVIAVIFWAVVALPLLAIYLLTIVLFCSEFIVRRIAEHPKGPIVAGSVLLVALLGVLRIILTGK